MKPIHPVLFLILLFFTGFSFQKAVAQEVHPDYELLQKEQAINLSQTIKIALANNIQVKQALLGVKTADQETRKAWSTVYPEISASASYTRNLEIPVFFFPSDPTDPDSPLRAIRAGEDNDWRAGLTVTQTIFDARAFIGVSSAEVFKTVQQENLRATAQQVVTDTRLAYYDVLIAEEQLRLEKNQLQRLLENLEVNEARYKAGLIDHYNVLQVQVQVSNQKPIVTQATYAVEQAYRNLKMVMGIPVELPVAITGNLGAYNILQKTAETNANKNLKQINTLNPYAFSADTTLIGVAKEYRGDIRVVQQQTQLKEREIKATKAAFFPELSASYNLNYAAQEPGALNFFGNEQNRVRTQAFMLTLSVPIFSGFSRSADVQIVQIEKKNLELQKRQTIRQAKNEIETARENLMQAIQTEAARKQAVRQAREGYERALERLENGLGTQLEVTEALFQLQQAELNYAQMVYNYLTAKARYDFALGLVPYVDESQPQSD